MLYLCACCMSVYACLCVYTCMSPTRRLINLGIHQGHIFGIDTPKLSSPPPRIHSSRRELRLYAVYCVCIDLD